MTFQKILREPMIHFLLIGACLFALFNAMNGTEEENPDSIQIGPDLIAQLDFGFERSWKRPPTPQEREYLINEYLRDEVFYREAVILGMDQGDQIIRRRLRQKLELILEDVSNLTPPSDEDLQQFLQENPEKFRQQTQVALRHIYFNPDKHPNLEQDIEDARTALAAGADPDLLGDPFLISSRLELARLDRFERDFGTRFVEQIKDLPLGAWEGPIQSGFGLHLVRIDEKVEGRLPEVAEIREKVLLEWQVAQKEALEEATFQKLLSKYEVEIDLPTDGTADVQETDK